MNDFSGYNEFFNILNFINLFCFLVFFLARENRGLMDDLNMRL